MRQIPIFVINLKRSILRRERMMFQLERLGLEYTFFDAVDGKDISRLERDKIQKNRDSLLHSHKFTNGEIGCALSHIKLYQHIVEHNIQSALILEDDVFLEERLVFLLDTLVLDQMPVSWDMLLCAYVQKGNLYAKPYKRAHIQFFNRTKIINRNTSFVVGKSIYFCFHTAGYMLSQQGAQKLLTIGMPIFTVADKLTGNAHVYAIHNYVLHTPCIRQGSVWSLDSTIKSKEYTSKQRMFARLSVSKNKTIQIFVLFLRVYFLCKNVIINMARGYIFSVRILQKLGLLPIQKIFTTINI